MLLCFFLVRTKRIFWYQNCLILLRKKNCFAHLPLTFPCSNISMFKQRESVLRKAIWVMVHVCEKKNRSLMFSVDRKILTFGSTVPVGNSVSLVSHWNGGPSGWIFLSPLNITNGFYFSKYDKFNFIVSLFYHTPFKIYGPDIKPTTDIEDQFWTHFQFANQAIVLDLR